MVTEVALEAARGAVDGVEVVAAGVCVITQRMEHLAEPVGDGSDLFGRLSEGNGRPPEAVDRHRSDVARVDASSTKRLDERDPEVPLIGWHEI